MGLKLLSRFMSESKAQKFRIVMDILFNILILVLIYQVSTNCTWFLGSENYSGAVLIKANLSPWTSYYIDPQGHLQNASAYRWATPTYIEEWKYNTTCGCINLTILC
jgi:hypothetical protein